MGKNKKRAKITKYWVITDKDSDPQRIVVTDRDSVDDSVRSLSDSVVIISNDAIMKKARIARKRLRDDTDVFSVPQ